MDEAPRGPGRIWYLVGAALIALGVLFDAQFLLTRIQGLGADMRQVVVPGSTNLDLAEPGEYTIFHERRSVVDGQLYTSFDISGLRVSVVGPDGAPVSLNQPAMTSRYTFNGREAFSIFTFRVERPGTYRLTAAYADGRTQPQAVLSVGHDFLPALLITIFSAIAIGFATLGLGTAIFVVTLVKRRRRSPPQPGSAPA